MLSGIRPWGADLLDQTWSPMSLFTVEGKKATARPGLKAIQTGLKQTIEQ